MKDDRVVMLHSIPLFDGIPGDQLLAVAEISDLVDFPAQHVIFEQGDRGFHLYVIVRGRVEVVAGTTQLAVLREQEAFGELAILDQEVRTATVRTLTPVTCLVLARDDFADLLDVSPSLAKAVIRVLTRRLRTTLDETIPDAPPGEG